MSWPSSDAQQGTHSMSFPLISNIFWSVYGLQLLGNIVLIHTDARGAAAHIASQIALNPWITSEMESCLTLFVPTWIMISLECFGTSPWRRRHKTFSILSPPIPKLFTGSGPHWSNLGDLQKLEIKESPKNDMPRFSIVPSSMNLWCFSPHDICPCVLSVLLRNLFLYWGCAGFGMVVLQVRWH